MKIIIILLVTNLIVSAYIYYDLYKTTKAILNLFIIEDEFKKEYKRLFKQLGVEFPDDKKEIKWIKKK